MKNVGHAVLTLKNRPRPPTVPKLKDQVGLKAHGYWMEINHALSITDSKIELHSFQLNEKNDQALLKRSPKNQVNIAVL